MGNQDQQSLAEAENKFMHFIRETQVNNIFVYREQLQSNAQRGKYFVKVDMEHLHAFDDILVRNFRNSPNDYIKVFESAVEIIYKTDYYDEMNPDMEVSPRFQVQIHSDEHPKMLRDLQSDLIGKLISIPGIIVSTSKSSIRARKAVFNCTNCGHEKIMEVPFGLTRVIAPSICDRQRNPGMDKQNCRLNSY
jgi:DNA replication licensing factor MCM5